MGHFQEAVQERDCLNGESDLIRMFMSIKEQKVFIDMNNEFALYCNERFKKRPMYKRPTRDYTKGGSD